MTENRCRPVAVIGPLLGMEVAVAASRLASTQTEPGVSEQKMLSGIQIRNNLKTKKFTFYVLSCIYNGLVVQTRSKCLYFHISKGK